MKTSFVLNMLLFCGALVLITACSQDSAMQACDSDNDCSSSQYCAKSGGVFFSTDHCVDRNHGETSEPDSESTDAGSTDAETTSDAEIGHDSTPQLPITCDSVCPGAFPVCDEVRS